MKRTVTEVYFHAESFEPLIATIDPTLRTRTKGLILWTAWNEDVEYDHIGIKMPFRPQNRFDKGTRNKADIHGFISVPLGHVAALFTYEVDGLDVEETEKRIGFDISRDGEDDKENEQGAN